MSHRLAAGLLAAALVAVPRWRPDPTSRPSRARCVYVVKFDVLSVGRSRGGERVPVHDPADVTEPS
jgi:hypothetical protein